jgi:hypothetical protein
MGRLIKLLIFLAIVGGIGLICYAYIGEYFGANFSPQQSQTRVPVILDTQ